MLRPIRVAQYLDFMANLGFPAADVLTGTNINQKKINETDYFIEFNQYQCLVENMIKISGNSGVGLDVGLSAKLGDFGILGYAALSCRTNRQSIDEFWNEYGESLGVMTKFTMSTESGGCVEAELFAPVMSFPAYQFYVEEALCVLHTLGKFLASDIKVFEALEFSYTMPLHVERYYKIFNCKQSFACSRTRVTMSREWLDYPLKTRDDEMKDVYQKHLRQFERQTGYSNPNAQIKKRILSLLMRNGGSFKSLEDVAIDLNMNPRTMRRHLQQDGESYRHLVEQSRMELAKGWLTSTNRPAKEIGHQLGFRDVNAFRRAFKAWTGTSIREYKSKLD